MNPVGAVAVCFRSRRLAVSIRHISRVVLPVALFSVGLHASDLPISLRIVANPVPPSGMAQVRVIADTPQPIAAGEFSMDFDPAFFGNIADVQVFSSTGDADG